MANTPNLSLPYPALSNAPNVPQDLQALASAVDTYVDGLEDALTQWSTYVPAMYTNMASGTKTAIAKTPVDGWYLRRGQLCMVHFDLTANAASANGVGIQLPFAAATRWVVAGSGGVFGTGASTLGQSGTCSISTQLTELIFQGWGNGYIDIVSGQSARAFAVYKPA